MASAKGLNAAQKKSLLYHAIFNYPLTKEQLHTWAISGKSLNSFPGGGGVKIQTFNDFYYVKGKKSNIKSRIQNEKTSKQKLAVAKRAGEWLGRIPTIEFVGLTGALAMNNAQKGSDIDFLIITKQGTLWTTRLLAFFLLKITGFKLRRAGKPEQDNALCLNMWLDTTALLVPPKKRNIYTAHEIAQIVPVINKNMSYEHLIVENSWIKGYWPNAVRLKKRGLPKKPTSYPQFPLRPEVLLFGFLWPLEFLAFNLQRKYMKKKQTREVATRSRALFHPIDWSKKVQKKLIPSPAK